MAIDSTTTAVYRETAVVINKQKRRPRYICSSGPHLALLLRCGLIITALQQSDRDVRQSTPL